MQLMREIDDSAKPYIEYLAGTAVPKVSPQVRHAVVQASLAVILGNLAQKRGYVGTELRCYLPLEPRRSSLVPDVAFVAKERLSGLSDEERERPHFAPDVAVEVRSDDDKREYLEWKIAAYLRYGSILVLDVLPAERAIYAHTAQGVRDLHEGDRFSCADLPWLTFDVGEVFAVLDE